MIFKKDNQSQARRISKIFFMMNLFFCFSEVIWFLKLKESKQRSTSKKEKFKKISGKKLTEVAKERNDYDDW